MIGDPDRNELLNGAEGRWRVEITYDYQMSDSVITQGQWAAVMGSQPWLDEGRIGSDEYGPGLTIHPDSPAVYITIDEASDFCTRLSDPDAGRYVDLPTEAEWEYACRAGSESEYFWGDDGYSRVDEFIWHEENSPMGPYTGEIRQRRDWGVLQNVRQLKPNEWGLYDCLGLVWEMVKDRADSYEGTPRPTGHYMLGDEIVRDFFHPIGDYVLVRGGAFNCGCGSSTCIKKQLRGDNQMEVDLGFRIVVRDSLRYQLEGSNV